MIFFSNLTMAILATEMRYHIIRVLLLLTAGCVAKNHRFCSGWVSSLFQAEW